LDFDTCLFHTLSRQATVALLFSSPDFLSRKWRVRIASGDLLPPSPQPRRRPLAKISPGSPAPTMGAGTARNTRLDAAMIFPVNKIPISTVIEGRGAQEMVALVLRAKNRSDSRIAPS
jgi:hypothetical protein